MSYVIAFIEKRQMSRVTCSVREVGEFVNIPKSIAYRALQSLTEKGFLVQFSRGTSSKKPRNRRAAIYGLGDPLNLRYGGRGGPSAKAYAYKHFAEERDSPEWEWVHHRGVCNWGQGLAPAPLYLVAPIYWDIGVLPGDVLCPTCGHRIGCYNRLTRQNSTNNPLNRRNRNHE